MPASNKLLKKPAATEKLASKAPQQPTQITSKGPSYSVNDLLLLQRQIGNQATQRLLGRNHLLSASPHRIQRVDFDNPTWSSAGSIRRSGEGAEGVVFV